VAVMAIAATPNLQLIECANLLSVRIRQIRITRSKVARAMLSDPIFLSIRSKRHRLLSPPSHLTVRFEDAGVRQEITAGPVPHHPDCAPSEARSPSTWQ
jgi:hypothetical protein